MKKALSCLVAVIIMISTGCEKEEEIVLSEYLIGEWLTPVMYSNYYSEPCHYEMIIMENNSFSIQRHEGGLIRGWTNWSYTVNDVKKTIKIISVDGNTTEVTYDVTLTDDPDTMIWTTEDEGGETFLWQRGEVQISQFNKSM
jgi:hypothetical protein